MHVVANIFCMIYNTKRIKIQITKLDGSVYSFDLK